MQSPVERVFHPTDFSPASHVAFEHALAIAIARKATLTIMNASKGFKGEDWSRYPAVSETLKRWGLLDATSERADVFRKLSVKVKKIGVDARDPADVILDYLENNARDLVVMATEARKGLPLLLEGSVAAKVTKASGARCLLIPVDCPGFVSSGDGGSTLKRVLVPVAETPDPNAAAEAAIHAAQALGKLPVELHAFHVGDEMPAVELPPGDDWAWQRSIRQGEVIEEILAAARDISADLIVMTTDGPDSFRDVFRGSHVHRVVRGAPCPVVAISIPKRG